jgi:hypothetical protein
MNFEKKQANSFSAFLSSDDEKVKQSVVTRKELNKSWRRKAAKKLFTKIFE